MVTRNYAGLSGNVSRKEHTLEAQVPGTLNIVSGIPGPPGKTPVKGVDYFTEDDVAKIVEEVKKSYSGDIKTDSTLKFEDGILSVNTTDVMEKDNTLPITSAGVYATVGNIEALLNTI